MIRTGYLRWELEVQDRRCGADLLAREVAFLARPTYRRLRVRSERGEAAAERFLRGEGSYAKVLKDRTRPATETLLTIPDVGPRIFRYSESDRASTPRFWAAKLQRESSAFAHEVVHVASMFPQLVIANPALRAGYAKLVEVEISRVISGQSTPAPTIDEPARIDRGDAPGGVPELVAAELVRDVVDPKEFAEFCTFDRVTVLNGDKHYRIPRRPHALIEVWDAATLRGHARLCVVFQDPGMPPSDEVVMKYLLAKHQPELLWELGIRYSPPTGKFDGAPPRRY